MKLVHLSDDLQMLKTLNTFCSLVTQMRWCVSVCLCVYLCVCVYSPVQMFSPAALM